MASIFGGMQTNVVTVTGSQQVSGRKRFLNAGNEMEGTLIQPTIQANEEIIDTTELSFLAGASSNIQAQFAGINIVLTGLTALEQALQALEPAPNATTVVFDSKIKLIGTTPNITVLDPINAEVLTYLPTQFVQANSNNVTAIPTCTIEKHTVFLQSSVVPLIDTLLPTGYSIPGGEQVNCFCDTGSYMFIGCESGNVYYFNSSTTTWDLSATFEYSVRCLYWHYYQSRLYIGGKFQHMSYPTPLTNLYNVCYATDFPVFNMMGVDVWSNYGTNGFDGAVNAITSDGSFMYFGGEFNYIQSNGLYCLKLACYDWSSTNMIYALDNLSGGGFTDRVMGLSTLNNYLCVVGEFNTIITNSGYLTANYCVSIFLNAGFLVGSMEFLYGNPSALDTSISVYGSVKNDGTYFYISCANSNIYGNGVNYLFQTPYYSFPSVSAIGNNAYGTTQTSFTLTGGIASVGYDNLYFVEGDMKASLPFQSYIYWNNYYGRVEFIDTGSGQIYAFTGVNGNPFVFGGGRVLLYNDVSYSGFQFSGGGTGKIATLFWNGYAYFLTANTGNGTPT